MPTKGTKTTTNTTSTPCVETVDDVIVETVPEAQSGTATEINPTYNTCVVRVVRCDASSLERHLNAIGYPNVDKILVEPSYNGAFFNIIYFED